MKQFSLLGVNLRDYSVRESMRRITLYLNNGICNTIDYITHDVLLLASDSKQLKDDLESMDMTVFTAPDLLAASHIKNSKREREIKSNLLLRGVLRKFGKEKRRIFLIARSDDILKNFEKRLLLFGEDLEFVGSCTYSEAPDCNDNIINEINASLPDVVMVKLPSPEAERLIATNKTRMNTQLVIIMRDASLNMPGEDEAGKHKITTFIKGMLFRSAAQNYDKNYSSEEEKLQ